MKGDLSNRVEKRLWVVLNEFVFQTNDMRHRRVLRRRALRDFPLDNVAADVIRTLAWAKNVPVTGVAYLEPDVYSQVVDRLERHLLVPVDRFDTPAELVRSLYRPSVWGVADTDALRRLSYGSMAVELEPGRLPMGV